MSISVSLAPVNTEVSVSSANDITVSLTNPTTTVEVNNQALSLPQSLGTGDSPTFTSVTAGSFVIAGADISEAELETIDSVTAGTVAANKAVVVDANKDISTFRNVTATTFIGALTGNASGSSGSCTGNAATATIATAAKGAAEVVSSSGTKAHDTVKTYVGKTVIYTASSGDLQIDLPEALEDIAEGEQIHFVNACTHSSGKIVIDYDAAAADQVIKICTGATVISIGSDNPHIVQGGVATLIAVSANNYVLFGSGVVDN